MAIQNRRGAYVDLNPAKAVPGELLVVQSGDPNTTDGKAVYITFASGDVKLLATKSDVETIVAGAVEDIVQDLEDTVDGYADRAETAASNAEDIVAGAEAAIEAKGAEVVDSIPSDYTALSDDVSDLKSALSISTGFKMIQFTPGYYIKTNIYAHNEVDLTPVSNSAFSYAIIPVSEGDIITLHAQGWTTGRLWCFVTSANICISVSAGNTDARNGLELIAPANAAKLIVNSYTASIGDCYIGETLPSVAEKTNEAYSYTNNLVILENEILTANKSITIHQGKNFYKNAIIDVDAEFTTSGDSPTINIVRYWYSVDGYSRPYGGSIPYIIGGNGRRKHNQFRFPGGVYGADDAIVLNINIPEGCTLTLYSLSFTYSDTVIRESVISLNAHGQCGYGGPANTEISFLMAAKLGYKYCITIPKVTSDGVYVCFHDDNNIQRILRNPDGTAIDSAYQNKPISDFTYSQILQFDAGIIRGMPFKGEKVPLLADFFKICAETGMHPMLSVHPDLSGHWGNIKALAKKYGVLDKLNIKAPNGTTLTAPMSVLLNDIESYTVDINSSTDAVAYMNGLKSTYNLDETKVKLGIEYFLAYATDANITAALNAGYFVAVANISTDVYETYASFIEKGVTQFTDDYCPNVGLRWY